MSCLLFKFLLQSPGLSKDFFIHALGWKPLFSEGQGFPIPLALPWVAVAIGFLSIPLLGYFIFIYLFLLTAPIPENRDCSIYFCISWIQNINACCIKVFNKYLISFMLVFCFWERPSHEANSEVLIFYFSLLSAGITGVLPLQLL